MPPDWPLRCYDEAVQDSGRALATLRLLLKRQDWIHSAIQSIEFLDITTVRHTFKVRYMFKVDLTVPDGPTVKILESDDSRLLPIALLRKGTLDAFDLRDGAGEPLPFLTRRHTGALAATALTSYAATFLGAESPDAFKQRLEWAADGRSDDEIKKALDWLHGRRLYRDLPLLQNPAFTLVLGTLARHYMLIVLMPAHTGERKTVTFSYESTLRSEEDDDLYARKDPLENSEGLFRRRLGWTPTTFGFPTSAAQSAASFQLRFSVPRGVQIVSAVLYRAGEPGEKSLAEVAGGPAPAELGVNDLPPGPAVQAEVSLEADRRIGWLGASLSITWVVTVVLGVGAWRIHRVVAPQRFPLRTHLTTTSATDTVAVLTALLIGLVAILAVSLTRSAEHRLLATLVSYRRRLAYASMALPLVAAAMLIFGPEGTASLTWSWAILAFFAVIIAMVFTRPYISAFKAAVVFAVQQRRRASGHR